MLFLSITQTKLVSSVEENNPLGVLVPATGEIELKLIHKVIITFYGATVDDVRNKYITWAALYYKELTKDGSALEENYHSLSIIPEGDISRATLSVPLSDNILAASLLQAVEPLLIYPNFQVSKQESNSGAVVKIIYTGNNSSINTFAAELEAILEKWVKKHGLP